MTPTTFARLLEAAHPHITEAAAAVKIDGRVFTYGDDTHYSTLLNWVRKTQLTQFQREDGGGYGKAQDWMYDSWPAYAKEHDVEEGFVDSTGSYFTRKEAVGLLPHGGREQMAREGRDWVDASDFYK